jgi:hypothetical protein
MAFNCLTAISDDHDRNHALVAEGAHFRLAPAFDLTPTKPTTRRRRQAMSIGTFGDQSTRENLVSAVAQFDLGVAEAHQIIDEIMDVVDTKWRGCLSDRDVSERDIEALSGCFDHSYFESHPENISVRMAS